MDKPQVVVLAGGLGTRLRPYTDRIPKALMPILGKPFVHYQLEWLARCGIQDVILSTGYLGASIREFVQEGQKWGLSVRYVDEGEQLRGTGGALRFALESGVLADRFLLTYGDSFLPVPFQEVWKHFLVQDRPALMTVYSNSDEWDSSNACFDGQRVTLYQKNLPPPKPPGMRYIDYGLSVFDRSILQEKLPATYPSDLADLFHQLSVEGKLAGIEIKQRFYEIGSYGGIADFESYLKSRPSF